MWNRRIDRGFVEKEEMQRPFVDCYHLAHSGNGWWLGPVFPALQLVRRGLQLLSRFLEGIARRLARPCEDTWLNDGWDTLGHDHSHGTTRPSPRVRPLLLRVRSLLLLEGLTQ